MASHTRTYSKKKLLGQIYTPGHIVEKILVITQLKTDQPQGMKILDPACGDGRFLVPIAERIIRDSDKEHVAENLLTIYGWDIDPLAIEACRKNLDKLLVPLGITVAWKLYSQDALRQNDISDRFDVIIGNPPYIRIQHLPLAQRRYIRETYSFCKSGSTDAYIAFFELATKLLTNSGICAFITPNSYLNSETGQPLRSYFEQNQNLLHITNYGTVRVFGNTGTYAAITAFGPEPHETFTFETCDSLFHYQQRRIPFNEIKSGRPWELSVKTQEKTDGIRLGEVCRISVGITTLADPYYLFRIIENLDDIHVVTNKKGEEVRIESALLKPIVKGSKLKTSADPVVEYILFPYEKDETGKHKIIPEERLKNTFPNAYNYFISIRPHLEKRDNGKPNAVAWYAFGRAQGLDSSFGKKIIFSPMNNTPNFVLYENPDCTVYSGYFIKYDGDDQFLLSQLNSERMAEFISIAGRDFQGGYKGYNKKIIENFVITDLQTTCQ
ncbi:Type IIS restriction enzyme Eco57I [Dyadobacter sp. CECT 9275]|uniref:site-specific DNA-methyltransferase (adenine-specific) n=1 Tax=Dyadobacter helix TaxID=2822344 RepID=A0A916JBL1_9BACT|nr:N-6 DNA methylase [Dyadobacter sp. CECT 9275]CAG4998126.1 Type IIS restriction enzyme Eco57I [Dyadobacter sp. CECT 9275]